MSRIASGTAVDVGSGRLTLLASYRSPDGALCREFVFDSGAQRANAVACRAGGRWDVAFLAAVPPRGSGYTVAGGDTLTDAYLERSGLGAPLSARGEKAALE